MKLNLEVSIGDIVSAVSLTLAIIGGIFAYYQWKKNTLLKRAEYINELTEKIRTDKDISETVYILDYGKPWYSREFHGSGENERKMDKTLSYFSYICYLKKQKIITKKEFTFFKYEAIRILQSLQIQDYFYNLYHFANKFGTPLTFKYLFEYGKENKMFDDAFYSKDSHLSSEKYHYNLNY